MTERFGGFALSIEAVELLLQALLGRLARVDGASSGYRFLAVCRWVGSLLASLAGGFDPVEVLATQLSSGLAIMRERALLLDGQLTIESRPRSGTQITAELPLGPQRARDHDPPRYFPLVSDRELGL
jgi:hypothetical protein